MLRHHQILRFWFGTIQENEAYLRDRSRMWFGGEASTDARVRELFHTDVEAAAQGTLHSWEESPLACLALILLLDQFPLHVYRGQPRGFEINEQALPVALHALEEGYDQRFHPIQRVFFYLPLEHAENLACQKKAVELFHDLQAESRNPEVKAWLSRTEWFAQEHCKVIERFGRFPNRNYVLGRPSTPAEATYLAHGGSPF